MIVMMIAITASLNASNLPLPISPPFAFHSTGAMCAANPEAKSSTLGSVGYKDVAPLERREDYGSDVAIKMSLGWSENAE
jgi:hypothetical protein